jgi:hypothetical protein
MASLIEKRNVDEQPTPDTPKRSSAVLFRVTTYAAYAVGIVLFGFGLYLFAATRTPGPLGIAFAFAGFTEVVNCYYLTRGSRLGWSFLCAQNALCAIAFLLAAPKIESAAGVPIWLALLPCAVFALLTWAFSQTGGELR